MRTSRHHTMWAAVSNSPLSRRTLRSRSASGIPWSCAGSSFQGSMRSSRDVEIQERGSPSAKDTYRLIQPDAPVIPDVMEHRGRDEDQAVAAIEPAAVAGEQ